MSLKHNLARDAQFIERPAPFADYTPELDARPRGRLVMAVVAEVAATGALAAMLYAAHALGWL